MTVYTESRLYLNLLHLPPKGSSEQDSGKLLNLFLSDLGVMTGIYTSQIPSIITSLIMMGIIGFRLFKIDIFIFFMLFFLLSYIFFKLSLILCIFIFLHFL